MSLKFLKFKSAKNIAKFFKNCKNKRMKLQNWIPCSLASSSSTAVEQLLNHPTVEGSCPPTATDAGVLKMEKATYNPLFESMVVFLDIVAKTNTLWY
jgi:hypothetical protein